MTSLTMVAHSPCNQTSVTHSSVEQCQVLQWVSVFTCGYLISTSLNLDLTSLQICSGLDISVNRELGCLRFTKDTIAHYQFIFAFPPTTWLESGDPKTLL